MATPGRLWFSTEVTTRGDGVGGRERIAAARCCGRCGRPLTADDAIVERFGEAFCSEPHAEAFVQDVRATRVRTAAAEAVVPGGERVDIAPTAMPARRDWKASLGRALCWGAPLLIITLIVLGGTGVLTSAAGWALPFLVALACPLGMYFMMRSMSKMGHDDSGVKREEK